MATLDKETLKSKFADGQKPRGEDFSDLIDTIQSGIPEVSTTLVPVSAQIATEGTDTTGFVSPSGVKAYVDGQRATQGEAQAGTGHEKLMTPLRAKEAISFQVPPLITIASNSVLNTLRNGVSTAYNTLKKLYNYINSNFYNRSQSDSRYDRKIDNISGTRISSGINASNVTTGTLSSTRIPNLDTSKITSGFLSGQSYHKRHQTHPTLQQAS